MWALPILVALYHTPGDDRAAGRRHKTPADLVRQLSRVLLRWFGRRRFVLTADGNYAAHALARFAAGQADRLTLACPFYPDANLYDPPPAYRGCGRPRAKGAKLPTPEQAVATAARTRANVAWYGAGGGTSRSSVGSASGTGPGTGWSRSGGCSSTTGPGPTGTPTS